jgi:hypothetical protein
MVGKISLIYCVVVDFQVAKVPFSGKYFDDFVQFSG